jgi:hypothetical protein
MEHKKAKEDYLYLNIVDDKLKNLLDVCKILEEKYDRNVLTGISFAHTRDNNYILGFVFFKDKKAYEESLKLVNSSNFKRVYTTEEDWAGLILCSDLCIMGHFSYKYLLKEIQEKEIQK